ncbi:MAG: hypothetical protein CL759_10970 [Chloroflexi bacterium]|nr:hypothetical protein [Chloroflexota bacterium]|tara:strand:- start:7456 stop:7902 length:447 start_codon:yes stop_codon:yes gene_type:complete
MEEVVRVQSHVTYRAASDSLEVGVHCAQGLGIRAAIVVVDAYGEIVAAAKLDGANPKAWRGALGKALVASGMGISTGDFIEKRLKQDDVLYRALSSNPDTFIVPGGFPLLYDGKPVGGVGVSGGHYEDDAQVAKAVSDRFVELVEGKG